MFPNNLILILLGAFGLIIGSFLAALSFRLPRGKSIAMGRSLCPHCHATIAWYDNLPLLSFLFLRGRCRHCHKKISPRYPLIEAATALLFVAAWLFLPHPLLPFYLLIFSLLIAIFVIDFEHQIIPDELVFLGLLATLLLTPGPLFLRLFLAFSAASFFLALNLITRGRGMGLGDVKLALFLGAYFSNLDVLRWLYFSFISGGAVAVYLLLTRKAKFGHQIPFGPFLIAGFLATLFSRI